MTMFQIQSIIFCILVLKLPTSILRLLIICQQSTTFKAIYSI